LLLYPPTSGAEVRKDVMQKEGRVGGTVGRQKDGEALSQENADKAEISKKENKE
jgi:hypothetical protein